MLTPGRSELGPQCMVTGTPLLASKMREDLQMSALRMFISMLRSATMFLLSTF